MKRLFVLGLTAFLLATGCSDEDTVFTPGAVDDPNYQTFTEEFGDVDEMNGEMVSGLWDAIDAFMQAPPTAITRTADVGAESFTWDDTNNRWEGSWNRVAENGTTFTFEATVQFWHGTTPVQEPVDELLTKVNTTVGADAIGEGITGHGEQSLVVVRGEPGTGILIVNGSSDLEVTRSRTYAGETGETSCTGTKNFESRIVDVVLSEENVEGCAISGRVSYSGTLNVSCTGAEEYTRNGHWTATRTFDGTAVSERFASNGRFWTVDSICD